jgi:type I restriction enzyme R subunit
MITEAQLEKLCISWFESIGYDSICGYDIAPDGSNQERSDYRQIILHERLLTCLTQINPDIPTATLEQVVADIARPQTPILIKNNQAFHRLLIEG